MAEPQPHIRCCPGDVAPCVLLPGDPGRIGAVARQLDEWREVAHNREFRTITGSYRGVPVSATSTGIGGPSAVIAVEELVRVGAKLLVRIGSAGGMQPYQKMGDLVVPVAAVREDGASAMYAPQGYPAVADHQLVGALLDAARQLGYTAYSGLARSHDSFYTDREDELMRFWSQKGVIASDMETAPLFTVARLRGARAASVLNVVVLSEGDLQGGINDLVSGEAAAAAGEVAEIRTALEALHRVWSEQKQ